MISILFLCIGNACRSQIAEGFGRALNPGDLEIFSAGSHPAGFVAEKAIEVMREKGIDISGQQSKGFTALARREFDYVITMGCGDACHFAPAKERIDWKIEDPIGKPIETFRRVRDEIEVKFRNLLAKLSA